MMSKILLVSGASSDIGGAFIRRAAKDYDQIVCHYGRTIQKIERLIQEFGEKIVPLQADFSDPKQVERFTAEMVERGLIPSYFVHLPAIPNVNLQFPKTEWADYENQWMVQVQSAYILCRTFLPYMAKAKFGHIVFMLTENVARNIPGKFAVPYSVAKFALLGLMKCLAAEYAEKGITINGISPSMIETAFVSGVPELTRSLSAESSPLKRNLTVDDVVPTIEFLLSDGAGMITGQNIVVMGGK